MYDEQRHAEVTVRRYQVFTKKMKGFVTVVDSRHTEVIDQIIIYAMKFVDIRLVSSCSQRRVEKRWNKVFVYVFACFRKGENDNAICCRSLHTEHYLSTPHHPMSLFLPVHVCVLSFNVVVAHDAYDEDLLVLTEAGLNEGGLLSQLFRGHSWRYTAVPHDYTDEPRIKSTAQKRHALNFEQEHLRSTVSP